MAELSALFVLLALWLFVPWSYWIDRHRVPIAETAAA
jgi:hypothetical protein